MEERPGQNPFMYFAVTNEGGLAVPPELLFGGTVAACGGCNIPGGGDASSKMLFKAPHNTSGCDGSRFFPY